MARLGRRQPFKPIIAPVVAAAGGITGDAAITEADDTLVSAGTVLIVGAAAITEADDTLAATGVVLIVGAAAVTEDADTLSATGTVAITGSAEITEAADTLTSAGTSGSPPDLVYASPGSGGKVRNPITDMFDRWREQEELLVLFDYDVELVKAIYPDELHV